MRSTPILIFAIIVSYIAPCSRAQTPTTAEMRETARENEIKQEELVNLEKETARALQANNAALFRQVYGDDFVGILPSGQTVDKAGWISAVENSGAKYNSFVATDIRVRVFKEMAVVSCLWSVSGIKNGRNFSQQFRVTHVYIYGQRGWQAVSAQETLLPG